MTAKEKRDWEEHFRYRFEEFEEHIGDVFSDAERVGMEKQLEPHLRCLRRFIEQLLGERDEDGELLPASIHEAPAFCRSECAGGAPGCQGCDHGGYGPGCGEESSLYLGIMVVRRDQK